MRSFPAREAHRPRPAPRRSTPALSLRSRALDVPNVTDRATLADRIEDLLPQTQCTKCGYAGCRPYAEAIAQGEANYNQCPPGGAQGIARLAAVLGKRVIALNPENGAERPRALAVIDESLCIGCTLCMQACPVDAIVGAPKLMHTVLAERCTGCDLCVAPCPVDCIFMGSNHDLSCFSRDGCIVDYAKLPLEVAWGQATLNPTAVAESKVLYEPVWVKGESSPFQFAPKDE